MLIQLLVQNLFECGQIFLNMVWYDSWLGLLTVFKIIWLAIFKLADGLSQPNITYHFGKP